MVKIVRICCDSGGTHLNNFCLETPLPEFLDQPHAGETTTNDQHIENLGFAIVGAGMAIRGTVGGAISARRRDVADISLERHDDKL